jgi:hypothetical protein
MARHHTEQSDYTWLYWIAGIGVVWYLYSSGAFTNLMNQLQASLPSSLTTATSTTNATGTPVSTPQPGIWQTPPTAVYQNDMNVSDIDQYTQ